MKLDASVLVALGSAILFYRVLLSLWGGFGLQARDIAVLSSERIVQNVYATAVGVGMVGLFDFDRARALVRQTSEAIVGVLLVSLGTVLTFVGLLFRRGDVDPPAIAGGFVAGLSVAWATTKACSDFLRRFKVPAWLDHSWMEWLEIQVPDPLDPNASVAQNLVVVARASSHPDLEADLRARFGNGPMLTEIAEATERWVAGLAARRCHCFGTAPWREWHRRMRLPAATATAGGTPSPGNGPMK